jgi:hypothetical protein
VEVISHDDERVQNPRVFLASVEDALLERLLRALLFKDPSLVVSTIDHVANTECGNLNSGILHLNCQL